MLWSRRQLAIFSREPWSEVTTCLEYLGQAIMAVIHVFCYNVINLGLFHATNAIVLQNCYLVWIFFSIWTFMYFVVTHIYAFGSKVLNTSKRNFCLHTVSNVKSVRLFCCNSRLKFASVFSFITHFKRIERVTMSNAFHRAIIQLPDTIHFRMRSLSVCVSMCLPSKRKSCY